jgi:hypothetical protein
MTATLPLEIARTLGLNKPGDEAALEVTEVRPDGVVVMVEAEGPESEPAEAPPELKAALAMG